MSTEEHHHHDESYAELRTKALESLLVDKGLIASNAIDDVVRTYEQDIGPMNGAKVVVKAWTDPEYKKRLLEEGTSAIEEVGFTGAQGAQIVVLENTDDIHNMVVCTLCSCYPWPVLGLPPSWYKSEAYRSRAVVEPRAVLKDFGLELDPAVNVRVWDSNSEIRYMVLPQRPSGTDGMTEEELIEIVGRDSMIGVAIVESPTIV
jgi:nitrile hydratase